MSIHEKCDKLTKESCLQRRLYNCTSNPSKLIENSTYFKLAIDTRIKILKQFYPNSIPTLVRLFSFSNEEFENYLDKIKDEYLNKGITIRNIKKKIKVNVRYATNICLPDSDSDHENDDLPSTYVTIKLSNSILKRTKTQLNTSSPIWNEILEFDYFNSYEIYRKESKHLNEKLIVSIWFEKGVKKNKSNVKSLPDANSECFGKIVLNIGEIVLDKDATYLIKSTNNDSDGNIGHIVLSVSFETSNRLSKISVNTTTSDLNNMSLNSFSSISSSLVYVPSVHSFTEQYDFLCHHIFLFLQKLFEETMLSSENDEWLLECVPKYFNDTSTDFFA